MLASEFLKRLGEVKTAELEAIKGIGPILAENLQEFLLSDRYFNLIKKFQDLESKGKLVEINLDLNQKSGELINEVICITGSFDIPREVIKRELESRGAKVVSTVTKKTTALLAGQEPGSKLQKAQELNIKILSEVKQILPDL